MRPFRSLFATPMPLGPAIGALLLVAALGAQAQEPTITGLAPVRNAVAAPRASNVVLTFS